MMEDRICDVRATRNGKSAKERFCCVKATCNGKYSKLGICKVNICNWRKKKKQGKAKFNVKTAEADLLKVVAVCSIKIAKPRICNVQVTCKIKKKKEFCGAKCKPHAMLNKFIQCARYIQWKSSDGGIFLGINNMQCKNSRIRILHGNIPMHWTKRRKKDSVR